jgi:hypothetical protein
MAAARNGSLAALAVALSACAAAPQAALPDAGADAGAAASRCLPPAGVSGAPKTIAETVLLANALPHPLELSCFLESLDRPLDAHAAVSTVSLQPGGMRSPRIFLFFGTLILTVVPEGTGRSLVEMGQLVGDDRSLKAELAFPITAPLTDAAPFEHVRDGEGTTCRFCHPAEARAAEIANAPAYVSGAFSTTARARVSLESVRQERAACDDSVEPARCRLLRALFDHGEVRWKDFPPTVPTAFDRR